MLRNEKVIKVVREWIEKAENDLKNATYTLKMGEDCPTDTTCFHTQQCVEKYLKAFLTFKRIDFPKTHDVGELLSLISESARPQLVVEEQRRLTAYAQNRTVATTGVTNGVGVFLLLKSKAKALKSLPEISPEPHPEPKPGLAPTPVPQPEPVAGAAKRNFRISGNIPPEIWNRLGTKILPKLRNGSDLKVGIEFTVTVDINVARSFEADLQQILEDLGIADQVRVEWS